MLSVVTKIKRVAWFDDRYYEMQFLDNRTEFYPSSTNILGLYPSEFLPRFRGDVGNREADLRMHDAARKGTRIHNAINIWLLGGVVLFEPDRYEDAELTAQNKMIIAQCHAQDIAYTVLHEQAEMIQVQRFKEWFDGFEGYAEVDAAELIVYSQKHRYAGTMDILLNLRSGRDWHLYNDKRYEIPLGLYVVDVKTGHMDDKYALQTASYANGIEEGMNQKVQGTIVVNTDSDPTPTQYGAKTFYRDETQWRKDFEDFLIVRRLYDRVHPNDQPKAGSFSVVLMREVKEDILTGFMPDRQVQEAKVGAINKVAEKEPVAAPAAEKAPLFKQDGTETDGGEEAPQTEDRLKKGDDQESAKGVLQAKVRALVLSVFPDPVKNQEQMKGAGKLMRRAFRDEEGKAYIQTFREVSKLTDEQIEKGMAQIESDVQLIIDSRKGGN